MSYKVKKGDTLSKIAKEHNMSLDELLKLNDIPKDKANHILVGQDIKVKKINPYQSFKTYTPFVPQNTYSFLPKTTDITSTELTLRNTIDKSQPSNSYWNPMKAFSNTEIKSTDSAGIPYKTEYNISEYAKNNASAIQLQLVDKGYNIGSSGIDGKWGKDSQAALDRALAEGYTLKGGQLVKPTLKSRKTATTPLTASTGIDPKKVNAAAFSSVNPVLKKAESDYVRYLGNFLRSPRQAVTDAVLYVADIAGAPTNATNYLRDLNVSLPYRAKSAVKAGFKTIMGDKSWEENYNEALANPGLLTRATTIRPLVNTNYNFSDEELAVLRDMAGSDFKITNDDIKRVSENKRYGGRGALRSYFSPTKIVQTAIGQSSGNADEKLITDIFDVNTVGEVAEKDNAMYKRLAAKSSDFGYEDLRATMPYYNMIDIIPNQYKIHTRVHYEK